MSDVKLSPNADRNYPEERTLEEKRDIINNSIAAGILLVPSTLFVIDHTVFDGNFNPKLYLASIFLGMMLGSQCGYITNDDLDIERSKQQINYLRQKLQDKE